MIPAFRPQCGGVESTGELLCPSSKKGSDTDVEEINNTASHESIDPIRSAAGHE
jgi:hypothetical protein